MSAPNAPQPLRHVWLAIGWIGVALSVYFSLKPHPPELDIQNGDKVQHLVGYALLMLWWVQLADTLPQRVRTAVALAALGIGLEIAQGFTGYREASGLDAIANTAGVLIGWVLAAPRRPNFRMLAARVIAGSGGSSPRSGRSD